MVLLLQNIFHSHKLPSNSKLENNGDRKSEALSASLHSFRSDISASLNQLSPNSKPTSEFLSLPWIHQCLQLLPTLNKALAKLASEIEYPIREWEAPSIEKYLNYSLKVLDFLNSITASLSHLAQARVSISHALSLLESSPESAIERLRAIQFKNQNNGLILKVGEKEEGEESSEFTGKQWVFHEAMEEMKRIGYWVCGAVLFGLSGDAGAYSAMERLGAGGGGFPVSTTAGGGFPVPKQLREVEEAAACVVAAVGDHGKSGGSGEELGRKLEVMEEMLDRIGKEADGIFSELLSGRNEALDVLRQLKQ